MALICSSGIKPLDQPCACFNHWVPYKPGIEIQGYFRGTPSELLDLLQTE
jgi:hypothetical protein